MSEDANGVKLEDLRDMLTNNLTKITDVNVAVKECKSLISEFSEKHTNELQLRFNELKAELSKSQEDNQKLIDKLTLSVETHTSATENVVNDVVSLYDQQMKIMHSLLVKHEATLTSFQQTTVENITSLRVAAADYLANSLKLIDGVNSTGDLIATLTGIFSQFETLNSAITTNINDINKRMADLLELTTRLVERVHFQDKMLAHSEFAENVATTLCAVKQLLPKKIPDKL